ncbi:Chromodomain_helicase-DNA-binding protein [Hexamita inflata]|uniref:Chromodomain helicase-DNA-binding protein n=1 Tax=Hexamita inflata TaxID=28002 RepID=A0AA86QB12_9EUKA|nr:Chromodomain helicase-DNA-binding protein [Hexamita inflata]
MTSHGQSASSIGTVTYKELKTLLYQEYHGYRYVGDILDDEPNCNSNEFIENECNRYNEKQIETFEANLEDIPICITKLFPSSQQMPQRQSEIVSEKEGRRCYKCQKESFPKLLFECSNCSQAFHLHCLPRVISDVYEEQMDPYHSISIKNLLKKKYNETFKKEEIENFYNDRGYYVHNDSKESPIFLLCHDCQEKACVICRHPGKTTQCTICKQHYHKFCQLEGQQTIVQKDSKDVDFVCTWCKIDGGPNCIDKIVSIKIIDQETLRDIAINQFKQYNKCQDIDYYTEKLKEKNQLHYPANSTLCDRILFLCKFKEQSYWRTIYISLKRLQIIQKSMIISLNLHRPFQLFYGFVYEFGINKPVDVRLTHYTEGEEEVDRELQLDFNEDETEEVTATVLSETKDGLDKEGNAEQANLASGFELYQNMSEFDYLLKDVDPVIREIVLSRFNFIAQQTYDRVKRYFELLQQNGVQRSYLEPEQILSRYNDAYLVKWKGLAYDDSSFEIVYFLIFKPQLIINFYLEQLELKRLTFLNQITLPLQQKSWWSPQAQQLHLGQYRELVAIPPYLSFNNKSLYQFQLTGVNWLLFTHFNQHGALFCDQMGLGKTVQAAAFIASLAESGSFGTHLVVVPTSTIENWARELDKWLPFMNVGVVALTDVESVELVVKSTLKGRLVDNVNRDQSEILFQDCNQVKNEACTRSREGIIDQIKGILESGNIPDFSSGGCKIYNGTKYYDVIIMSYDTVANFNQRQLGNFKYSISKNGKTHVVTSNNSNALNSFTEQFGPFSTMICDEGHRLKGGNEINLVRVLNKIQAKQRIILTGTPVQNNFEELVNLLQFVDQDYFNPEMVTKLMNLAEKSSSLTENKDQRDSSLKELHSILKPFMLIRAQADVFNKPIKKVETFVPVDMTSRQKMLYGKILFDNRKNLSGIESQRLKMLQKTAATLRHAANHPILLNKNYMNLIRQIEIDKIVQMSAKMAFVDRLVPLLIDRKRKVLIYSQFVMILNILEVYFIRRNIKFLRIDGGVTAVQRQELIDKFNDPKQAIYVFILSTQAGGMGINLQAAQDVIIYDASWNPQNDIQAIHRSARIGQTKTVHVYKLFCRDSMDQKILERAKKKLSLSYIVVRPMVNQNQNENLDEILAFGCKDIMETFKDQIKSNSMDQLLQLDDTEGKVINYTEEALNKMIDQDDNDEEQKFVNQQDQNQARLNKNDFFAGFKCANFTVISKEETEQQIKMNPTKKSKKSKENDKIAEDNKVWDNLFKDVFGDEENEQLEKKREEARQRRMRMMQNISSNSDDSDDESSEQSVDKQKKIMAAYQQPPSNSYSQSQTPQLGQNSNMLQQKVINELNLLRNKSDPIPIAMYSTDLEYQEIDKISRKQLKYEVPDQQLLKQILDVTFQVQSPLQQVIQMAFKSHQFPLHLANESIIQQQLQQARAVMEAGIQGRLILCKHCENAALANIKQMAISLNLDQSQIQEFFASSDIIQITEEIKQNVASNTIQVYKKQFNVIIDQSQKMKAVVENYKWSEVTDMNKFQSLQVPQNEVIFKNPFLICEDMPSLLITNEQDTPTLAAHKTFLTDCMRKMVTYYHEQIINAQIQIIKLENALDIIHLRRVLFEIFVAFSCCDFDENQLTQIVGTQYSQLKQDLNLQPPQIKQNVKVQFNLDTIQQQMKQLAVLLLRQQFHRNGCVPITQYNIDTAQKILQYYQSRECQIFIQKLILFSCVVFQTSLLPQVTINQCNAAVLTNQQSAVRSELLVVTILQGSIKAQAKQVEQTKYMKTLFSKMVQKANFQASQIDQNMLEYVIEYFQDLGFQSLQESQTLHEEKLSQLTSSSKIFNLFKGDIIILQNYFSAAIAQLILVYEMKCKEKSFENVNNIKISMQLLNHSKLSIVSMMKMVAFGSFAQTWLTKLNIDKTIPESYAQIALFDEQLEFINLTEGTNIINVFDTNRLLNKESKRQQITEWFKVMLRELPSLQRKQLIGIAQSKFLESMGQSDFMCLLGGVVMILLYRYGYMNYLKYSCLDKSANLSKLLDIIITNVKDSQQAVYYLKEVDPKKVLSVQHPYQIMLATNMQTEQKCQAFGAILFSYGVAMGLSDVAEQPITSYITKAENEVETQNDTAVFEVFDASGLGPLLDMCK